MVIQAGNQIGDKDTCMINLSNKPMILHESKKQSKGAKSVT